MESHSHEGLSEPGQHALCLPDPCSVGGCLHPLTHLSFYHRPGVLARGQGLCEGHRGLPGNPFPPCLTYPVSGWLATLCPAVKPPISPPQHLAIDENTHFFLPVLLHFCPTASLGQSLLPGGMATGWEPRDPSWSPSSAISSLVTRCSLQSSLFWGYRPQEQALAKLSQTELARRILSTSQALEPDCRPAARAWLQRSPQGASSRVASFHKNSKSIVG